MVHCPKCSSPIGMDLPACSICHKAFSAADRETMASEQAAYEKRVRDAQKHAVQEFRLKRAKFTVILLADIFLSPFVVYAVARLTHSGTAVTVALVISFLLMIGIIIGGIVTGAARCPHCDAILFRQYGPHCHSCGGKLE